MPGLQLNIWSVIILTGAVQGFVLTFALLGKSKANRFLSLLILVLSLHLVEYTIAISGYVMEWPHTVASTYSLLFLMGPFYYLYSLALFQHNFQFRLKFIWHFLPAVLVLISFLPFYAMSGDEKIAFLRSVASGDQIKIPASQLIFMVAHVIQTLIYVVLAYRVLSHKKKILVEQNASTAIRQFQWLRIFTIGFSIYLALYMISIFVIANVESHQVEIDYVMLLLTAIIIYAIGYTAIRQPVFFDYVTFNNKYQNSSLNPHRIEEIKAILDAYLKSEKPYLQENLKLSDLATSLNIPNYQLSEVINNNLGKNFFDFINQYRIEEAKTLLKNPSCADLKIIAIAFDSGFGNKATFNRVFKKSTGMTPSEYKSRFAGAEEK